MHRGNKAIQTKEKEVTIRTHMSTKKEQSRNKPDAKISSDVLIKLLEDSIGESTPALSLPPRIK